jgi:hypothetical protein
VTSETPGKGRPTPKRSEAERKRVVSRTPQTRKEAAAAMRERRRTEYAENRAAMKSGDVTKLPAAERTPEKILIRNVVDRRRNVGWVTFPVLVPLYVLGNVVYKLDKGVGFIVTWIMLGLMLAVAADSVRLWRLISRTLRERLPATAGNRGLRVYGVMRAVMPRRFRQPKAILKVGDPLP